jgi:hypothetical protein
MNWKVSEHANVDRSVDGNDLKKKKKNRENSFLSLPLDGVEVILEENFKIKSDR